VYTRKNVREEEERVTVVATFGLCSSGGSKLRMTRGGLIHVLLETATGR